MILILVQALHNRKKMKKAIIFDFFGVLESHGQPNAQLLDYIRQKLKRGHKIGLLSNSSGQGMPEFFSDKDELLFDDMVFSGQVGVAKPNPEIYKIVAKKLGVEPIECIYIDDDDYRVEGAKVAGMQTILYENFNQTKTDLEALL